MSEVIVPLEHDVECSDDAEDLGWQDRALCAQTDPEAFFPEKGGSTREAKKVCRGCEVRAECLEFALENDERFGIWGGMSERERRRLKREAGLTLAPPVPSRRGGGRGPVTPGAPSSGAPADRTRRARGGAVTRRRRARGPAWAQSPSA